MSQSHEQESPIDRTIEISNDFKNTESAAGSIAFSGLSGYHTYWKGNEPGDISYAMQTALHAAVDKAWGELWLDADIVEENHGEFSPETAARELALQLEEFFRIDPEFEPWAERLVEEFEDTLREYQRHSEDLAEDTEDSQE